MRCHAGVLVTKIRRCHTNSQYVCIGMSSTFVGRAGFEAATSGGSQRRTAIFGYDAIERLHVLLLCQTVLFVVVSHSFCNRLAVS